MNPQCNNQGDTTISGLERVVNVFAGRSVDRLPVGEDFWGETLAKWRMEGNLGQDESPTEHFELDLDRAGLVTWYVNPADGWTVVEEDDETVTITDPNGATIRTCKGHAGGSAHISCRVYDRETWESFAKPHLSKLDPTRIPFEAYRKARMASMAANRHFSNDGFGPFEMMHRLLGHENLLMSMALEPEWVRDMADTYCEFNIRHWDELFRREGLPQATWIAEDLGYKFKPFMSNAMFEEIFLPGYARMFEWLHGRGLKVILHSCGFVEPFLSLLFEAGLDCLEGMEVKAGMDLPTLFRTFGDRVVWYGNIDIRTLESNDLSLVAAEVKAKVGAAVCAGARYMVHSDHSISPKVEYSTYRAFLERVRRPLGTIRSQVPG